MLLDFIIMLPYYIVRLIVPDFVWEKWFEELRNNVKTIPPMCSMYSVQYKELVKHNRRLENSIKARLVLTRWPWSISFR